MVLDSVFNAIFGPFAKMGSLYAITAVSIVIALIFSGLYRVLVHRGTFIRIKSEQKELQQKMKNAQKSKDDKALKDLFSSSMSLQHRMMMLTIKPMIASMLVFLLIVPWLSGTYGDVSVKLVDGKGAIKYNGVSGEVKVIEMNGDIPSFAFPERAASYAPGDKIEFAGKAWMVDYKKDKNTVVLENVRFSLPFKFPGVGTQVGWLGIYIIVSLPATILFRKILGVD